MLNSLERAVARFRPKESEHAGTGDAPSRISAAAFRAVVNQRLQNLERDVGELKGRLNGLIFVVMGAVIAQLVLRLVG